MCCVFVVLSLTFLIDMMRSRISYRGLSNYSVGIPFSRSWSKASTSFYLWAIIWSSRPQPTRQWMQCWSLCLLVHIPSDCGHLSCISKMTRGTQRTCTHCLRIDRSSIVLSRTYCQTWSESGTPNPHDIDLLSLTKKTALMLRVSPVVWQSCLRIARGTYETSVNSFRRGIALTVTSRGTRTS